MTALRADFRGRRRHHTTRRLHDLLRADALRGTFTRGRLPSEADLMMAYGVSRGTVRDVLARLRAAGIVERLQGAGTLVVGHRTETALPEAHGVVPLRSGVFTGELRVEILDRQTIPMPPSVAQHLGESPGSPCLRLDYIGLRNGEAHGIATNYLRYPEADAVEGTPFRLDWYTLLEQSGLTIGETEMVLEATLADDLTADLLGISPGAPLLSFEQVIRAADGRPYDYALFHCRGDRVSLLSTARRPATDDAGGTTVPAAAARPRGVAS